MKDIPQIPENTAIVHPDLRRSLVRIREELQSLLGLRGDSPALRAGQGLGGSTTVVIDTGGGGGGGGGTPDLTPPPTPTFGPGNAFPGITTVLLTWAGIGYTQGNGNKQTVIYGVQREPNDPSLPTFGDAQRVAVAPHPLTLASIPSEPNTRWHFWLKFETNDGVESVAPAGGTNGVTVTTGQDVSDLLTVLANQITASELSLALARPITSIAQRIDEQAANVIESLWQNVNEQDQRATAILQERTERVAADEAEAALRTALGAQLNDPVSGLPATRATLLTSYYTKVQTDAFLAAESGARLTLESQVNNPTTGLPATRALLLSDYYTRAATDTLLSAESAARLLLSAQVNDPATGLAATRSTLLTDYSTTATMNAAIASSASTLTASFTAADATLTAAVATEASVRASETGHLAAQATTRLDLNGYVVGYGISGTSGGTAGPTSQFLVRADQFSVVAPTNYTQETAPVGASLNERWRRPSTGVVTRWDGAAWVPFNPLPFTIQAAPTVVNGVTIPSGVYIDAAYIVNLTATYAQISNLIADQINTSELNAARLTLGDGTIGGRLKSSNYVAGSTGWIIRPDGTAEFSGVIVRGTIFATAGLIAGIAITATGCNSSDYVPGTAGWAIKNDGTAEFGAAAIRGPLTLGQIPQISDVAMQVSNTSVQTAANASEKTWLAVERAQVSSGSPVLLTASSRVLSRISGTNHTSVASIILSVYLYVDTEVTDIASTSATAGPVPLFSGVRYVQQSLNVVVILPTPTVGTRTYRVEARAQLRDADGNPINVGLIDCDSTVNLVVLELKK